jgi:hypothetical protein
MNSKFIQLIFLVVHASSSAMASGSNSSCFQYMKNLQSSIADESGKPTQKNLSASPTSVLCLLDYGECSSQLG